MVSDVTPRSILEELRLAAVPTNDVTGRMLLHQDIVLEEHLYLVLLSLCPSPKTC